MREIQNILRWLDSHLQLSLPDQAAKSGVDRGTLRRWLTGDTACPQPLRLASYLSFLRREGLRLNPTAFTDHGGEDIFWLEPGEGCVPHEWDATLFVSGRTRAWLLLLWRGGELVRVLSQTWTPHLHLTDLHEDLATVASEYLRVASERYDAA